MSKVLSKPSKLGIPGVVVSLKYTRSLDTDGTAAQLRNAGLSADPTDVNKQIAAIT